MRSSFLVPLKILLLSFYYPPDLGPGSLRAESIIDALIKYGPKDLKIDVVTTMPNRYKSYDSPIKKKEIYDNFLINRISIPRHQNKIIDQSKSFAFFCFRALKFIKKNEYEIVVATSSRLMTAALGAYVAKKNHSKLYLDIRDLFTDTMNSLLKKRVLRILLPFFYIIEKWTFNSAHRINIVSGGFQNYFDTFYPNKKLSTHTNGIDDYFLDYNYSKNLNNKNYEILYAGNIGEGQGLHKILPKVASKKPDINFKIIGDGSAKDLLVQSNLYKKLKNIFIINPISRNELIREYDKTDILLIHLNDYEAFKKVLPSKIFEYAATNKPILAGVSGYAAKFIKQEVDGIEIFSPCNEKEMIESINKLIDNSKFIDRRKFFEQYRRKTIMQKVAKDILSLGK